MKTLLSLLQLGLEAVGGSQSALAKAFGIGRPRVNRLLVPGGSTYPLGAQACFRLSELIKKDVTLILRLANKAWLADEIEGLRKRSGKERLTTAEQRLVTDYQIVKARAPKTAARLRGLLEELATDARTRPAADGRRGPTARRRRAE